MFEFLIVCLLAINSVAPLVVGGYKKNTTRGSNVEKLNKTNFSEFSKIEKLIGGIKIEGDDPRDVDFESLEPEVPKRAPVFQEVEKSDEFDTIGRKYRNSKLGSSKKKKKKGLFEKLFPMFVIPYLVQSAILPMLLMSIKFMLVKTLFVGKLALILLAFNAFKRRYDNQDGMKSLMVQHYGYNGGDEYGAFIN